MNFITILVYLTVSFVFGVFLIGTSGILGSSFDIESIKLLLDHININILHSPSSLNNLLSVSVFSLLGLLIILVALRFIQTLFFRVRREKAIKFEAEEGQISITLSALEDMIKKCLEKEEENISHIKPKIIITKKCIGVNIKLVLKTETNINEFAKDIQQKIKSKIEAILGAEKDLKVNIEVRKIVFNKKNISIDDDDEGSEEGPFRKY